MAATRSDVIARLVARAPSLTDEQCDLIRQLMPPPERRPELSAKARRVAS